MGTTSATSILTVGNGSAANKVITINGGTGGSLGAGVVLQRNSTQTAIFSTDSLIGGSADGASIWSSEATRFYTNGSNERMRIDNSGNLLLNTTSQSDSARFTLAYSTGVNNGISFVGNATSAQNACVFRNTNGQVGSIVTSGSTTTYNITSDQRLKTNIVDAPEGNIDQIKIRSFDWKSDGSHNTYGVIAQELLEVAPYAVHVPANPDEMMGVDYSKLVPMMIKEIQSLKAEVALSLIHI